MEVEEWRIARVVRAKFHRAGAIQRVRLENQPTNLVGRADGRSLPAGIISMERPGSKDDQQVAGVRRDLAPEDS